MASDKALRMQFREEIYPIIRKNFKKVMQLPYQDLDVNGNIVNKTLITAPIALVLQDPLDGGDGSLNLTMYVGVGVEATQIIIPFLDT
jgi:hypothetical protein